MRVEELDGLLGEGEGAADVGGEGLHEVGMGFFQEGLFGGVFDGVDGEGKG